MKYFQAYLFRIFCIRTYSLPSLFQILSTTSNPVLHFFWHTQRLIYPPYCNRSVSPEYIPGIYLLLHVIKTGVIAVCDDGMALCLESCQIIDYLATKEGAAVFQCWFIDDDLCTLCLDTLHDALYGWLAEVVGIGFHRQAIDSDDAWIDFGTKLVVLGIAVPTGFLQYGICDIVFAGTV